MTLSPGTAAPLFDGHDDQGELVMLPALERWTHLWFNPIFKRYGCKECQASLLHELYPELRMEGCFPFGATYDPPEANARRNAPHVWRVPIVQVTMDDAEEWGAARDPDDSWAPYVPRSVAYLIDPTGVIRFAYDDIDPKTHARSVLGDLRASLSVNNLHPDEEYVA